jgi:hypothetical protein
MRDARCKMPDWRTAGGQRLAADLAAGFSAGAVATDEVTRRSLTIQNSETRN